VGFVINLGVLLLSSFTYFERNTFAPSGASLILQFQPMKKRTKSTGQGKRKS